MEESGLTNFTLQEVTHLRLEVDEILAPAPLDNKDAYPAHNVDIERYYTFWKRLEHPDFATFFAESLLRRLKEVQLAQASSSHASTALPSTDDESTPRAVSNGTPKHFRQTGANKAVGNSRSQDTDNDRLKTAMVGTLYILALYLPVDEEDASLQAALKAAQRALRKQRVTPERESDIDFQSFVMQLFDPNSCASQLGEFKPTKFVLWVRQMQVVVLHCVNRVCETSKLGPTRGGGGLEGTASFMWLLESLQSTNGAPFKAVLDCISDFMVWPASVQRDQALCCCLIMIRRFMVNYIVEVGMLDESIYVITPLYRFRNPVGLCAKATLTMLAREQRAPGSSFQERLAMEVDEFSLRGVDKAATQQSGTGAGNYPRGTRVYVLVNMNAKQGGSFREKLDWTPRQQDQTELQQSIKPTQLQLLVSMMAHAGLTDRSTELAKIDAQSVDTPTLRTMYRRALVAAMRAQQVESLEEATKHRVARLGSIATELLGLVKKDSETRSAKKHWRMLHDYITASRANLLAIALQSARANAQEMQPPPVPALEFELVHTELLYRPSAVEVMDGMLGNTEASYPGSAGADALVEILLRYHPRITHDDVVVKIGIAGGDGTVHHCLLAWIHILLYRYDLLQGINVQFYLLPCGANNMLASHLAMHDVWFGGMVMSAVQSPLSLVPMLSAKGGGGGHKIKDKEKKQAPVTSIQRKSFTGFRGDGDKGKAAYQQEYKQVLPNQLLQLQVQNYFREADIAIPISVFVCEGWSGSGKKQFQHHLPFCCRMELGLTAYLADTCFKPSSSSTPSPGVARPNNLQPNDSRLEELKYKYKLEAALSLNEVDMCGIENSAQTLHPARSFLQLNLCNVATPADQGLQPDPTSDNMMVQVIESDWYLKGRRGRRPPVEDFSNAPCYRAAKLQIDAQDSLNPFNILLDGELYGPFFKVRIYPCRLPGARADTARFPVMASMEIN